MDQEAKYWRYKWSDAQKEIQALKQILQEEFEWMDQRTETKLIQEVKKNGKPRTKQKTRFL